MYIYAQIQNGKVIGVSYLKGEVMTDSMINISDLKKVPDTGWDYDLETGEFTEPIYIEPEQEEYEPSINEKILIENQYQTALIEMQMMGGM